MKNKRGLSTVVATLLVILITISAAVLIARAVIPFVKNNLAKSSECLDYKDYFKFQDKISYNQTDYRYNCYNSNLYGFSINTQGSNKQDIESPKGFLIAFSDGQNSQSIEVDSGMDVNPLSGGVRMLSKSNNQIVIPELGGIQTYVYNGTSGLKSMQIRAILKNGRICDKADEITTIIPCDTNIDLNLP